LTGLFYHILNRNFVLNKRN